MEKSILSFLAIFFINTTYAQNVGVGTNAPTQKLEVNGKLKLGNDAQVPAEGTIRWNSTSKDFEGFTGTTWLSLTKPAPSQLGEGSTGPVENYKAIFPSDINEEKEFGFAVDIDSNYAIIGALKNSFTIGSTRKGAAYIFVKLANGNWQQQAKLLPDVGDTIGGFGYRVAIYGDYAAVTDFVISPSVNANPTRISQVYIFKRTGNNWAKQTILNEVVSSSGPLLGTEFGASIDLDSTHIVIGAPIRNQSLGDAFVYQRSGISWTGPVTLTHQTTNVGGSANFGSSVCIYNSTIIVGSPGEGDLGPPPTFLPSNVSGRLYLYRKTASTWNKIFDIMPNSYGNNPDNYTPLNTEFGSKVAIYFRYMIVAAPLDNSVFIYDANGVEELRVSHQNIKAVGMYNNKAIVLAGNKVYVYKLIGDNWSLYAYYADTENGVPQSAAIWNDEIIMGIPFFYRCVGVNCFNVGKATFATVE